MERRGLTSRQPSPVEDRYGLHVAGPTSVEEALYAMLEEEEIVFIREWTVPGTNFRVDAYDPVERVAYEADGHPWHFTPEGRRHDRHREQVILATGHVRRFVRLTARELTGWM